VALDLLDINRCFPSLVEVKNPKTLVPATSDPVR